MPIAQSMSAAFGQWKFSVVVDKGTVNVGLHNLLFENAALERTPSAKALNNIFSHFKWTVGSYECEIGLVAFSDMSPVFDAEEFGRVVTHERHQLLNVKQAFLFKLQHGW